MFENYEKFINKTIFFKYTNLKNKLLNTIVRYSSSCKFRGACELPISSQYFCRQESSFYSKLAEGSRAIVRPLLRLKDLCKRDLKTCGIDIANWEVFCTDRIKWRKAVKKGALKSEILREEKWEKEDEKQKKSLKKMNLK